MQVSFNLFILDPLATTATVVISYLWYENTHDYSYRFISHFRLKAGEYFTTDS